MNVMLTSIPPALNLLQVMDLMDNTLWNRQMKDVTLDVVDLLVRQIYAGIRAYMVGRCSLTLSNPS